LNDFDLRLEVVSGHVNHCITLYDCITFAIECTWEFMYAFSPDVYIFDFRRLVYIGVTVNYNLTNLNKLVSDY